MTVFKFHVKNSKLIVLGMEILFGVTQGSILGPILILQVMLTTTQFMIQVIVLMRSYFPCENLLKNFLKISFNCKHK